MKMMIAIGLGLLASGCSVKLAENYHVSIDPTFTPEVQSDIITSMQNWETALDHRVSFEYGFDADCKRTDESNLVCIHSTTKAWIDTTRDMGNNCIGLTTRNSDPQNVFHQDSSDIYLPADYFATYPQFNVMVSMHELGHAMGLNHTHVDSDLMYPALSTENLHTPQPSCDDADQWTGLRNQYDVPSCGGE
jgi:hypothetical protein